MLRRTKILVGLAALLGVTVLSPPTAIGDVEQFKMHIEEDAPGYDYQQFDPPSLSYCQSRCQEEAQCKAFTYNTVRRVCFLKHKAGFPLRPHSEAITGRKTGSNRFSIRRNRDAPGYDYARIDPPTLSDCNSRCGADPHCKTFSYNVTKNVCFLKYEGNIQRIHHDDAITGVKAPTTSLADGLPGRHEIPLLTEGGMFKVRAVVNGVMMIHFTVDSGASVVVLPPDIVLSLRHTGTLRESDFLGPATVSMADGSQVTFQMFRIRRLQVGDHVIDDVMGAIAPQIDSEPLLGQSFLSRFNSWSMNYQRQTLILE